MFASGGGLDGPHDMAFDSQGRLYVTSLHTSEILRYDPDGKFLDVFVSASKNGGLLSPLALAFGNDGNLYVTSAGTSNIKLFSGVDGTYLNDIIPAGDGGLNSPNQILFVPEPTSITLIAAISALALTRRARRVGIKSYYTT